MRRPARLKLLGVFPTGLLLASAVIFSVTAPSAGAQGKGSRPTTTTSTTSTTSTTTPAQAREATQLVLGPPVTSYRVEHVGGWWIRTFSSQSIQARLTTAGGLPLANRVVRIFYAHPDYPAFEGPWCSSVTDDLGIAGCGPTEYGEDTWGWFGASFDGDARYEPSSAESL